MPLAVALAAVGGCASVHEGQLATPADAAARAGEAVAAKSSIPGLVISSTEATELSSPYLGFVQVTFENRSASWIRLGNVALDFGGAARNAAIDIPAGNDLVSWHRTIVQRNRMSTMNADVALGALALTGAVVGLAASGSSERLSAAGNLVGAGAAGTLAVRGVGRAITDVERGPVYPDTHLLAPELAIPPGLFVKRWVLLHTKNDELTGLLTSMKMSYVTEAGATESVLLRFRGHDCTSEWQARLCARPRRQPH